MWTKSDTGTIGWTVGEEKTTRSSYLGRVIVRQPANVGCNHDPRFNRLKQRPSLINPLPADPTPRRCAVGGWVPKRVFDEQTDKSLH